MNKKLVYIVVTSLAMMSLLVGCGEKAEHSTNDADKNIVTEQASESLNEEVKVPTEMEEKKAFNSYFPYEGEVNIPVKMVLEVMIKTEATMQMKRVDEGKEGVLYSLNFVDLKNTDTSEFEITDMQTIEVEKMYSEMGLLQWGDLWVTKDKIYYISYWEKGEKKKLIEEGMLPESASLVCQEEEMVDKLKEGEAGDHQWIEKHGDDFQCFRAYTEREDHNDTTGIFQFVWKKDVGLVGCRFLGHAAGGSSVIAWQDEYLEYEDMGFSIDMA